MFISGDYILGVEYMGLELSPLLAWAGMKKRVYGFSAALHPSSIEAKMISEGWSCILRWV